MTYLSTDIRVTSEPVSPGDGGSGGSSAEVVAYEPNSQDPIVARRANSYINPRSPAWGVCWLLLAQGDIEALKPDRTWEVTFAHFDVGQRVIANRNCKIKKLHLLYSERLFPGDPDDDDTIHLCKLVDSRYFAAKMSDTSSIRQFNVLGWAVDPGAATRHLSLGANSIWSQVSGDLWIQLGMLSGADPGFGPNVSAEPTNIKFNGQNAWYSFNWFLEQFNATLVYNPYEDTFETKDWTAAQVFPAGMDGRHIRRRSKSFSFEGSQVADRVNVYFHKHWDNYGQEPDTERTRNFSQEQTQRISSATGVQGAIAGTEVALWSELNALYDENNILRNQAEIGVRAIAMRDQYVARKKLESKRERTEFTGFFNDLFPGSEVAAVTLSSRGRDLDGSMTTQTRHPGTIDRVDFDSMGKPTLIAKSQELFQPPDIARNTYKNWPRLPNIVRVNPTSEAVLGHLIDPDASENLFDGTVYRYEAGSINKLLESGAEEKCWIVNLALVHGKGQGSFLNTSFSVPLRAGARYYGRLCGIRNVSGDIRPVYEVSQEQQYVYTCRADMTPTTFACPGLTMGGEEPQTPIIFPIASLVLSQDASKHAAFVQSGDTVLVNTSGQLNFTFRATGQRDSRIGIANEDDAFQVFLALEKTGAGGPAIQVVETVSAAILDDVAVPCDTGTTDRATFYKGTAGLPTISFPIEAGGKVSMFYERIGGKNDHLFTFPGSAWFELQFISTVDATLTTNPPWAPGPLVF